MHFVIFLIKKNLKFNRKSEIYKDREIVPSKNSAKCLEKIITARTRTEKEPVKKCPKAYLKPVIPFNKSIYNRSGVFSFGNNRSKILFLLIFFMFH